MNAPIILFVYARPEHTLKTLNALKKNNLAKDSALIIYSDSSSTDKDIKKVDAVRKIIKSIDGFRSIKIIERSENYGLAQNIIEGVTEVINEYRKAIVIEDDMITSPQFLTFMNNALSKYEGNKEIWHISGWNYNISSDGLPDAFFWKTMNCWGWATWSDRWLHFKKEPKELINTWSKKEIGQFNLNGAYDFWAQVKNNYNKKTNTWAIFWYATIFRNNGLCLNPASSYVNNIGNDGSGENCGKNRTYDAILIDKEIELPNKLDINILATNRIIEFYKKNKKPIYMKILSKIKRTLYEN